MSYMKRQRNEDSTINFIPEPEISGGGTKPSYLFGMWKLQTKKVKLIA